MTLEEAERVLLDLINITNICNYEPKAQANLKYENSTYRQAIDKVLIYIENESIPKEKVKNKIEEIRGVEWQPGTRTAGKSVKYWKLVGKEEALQELLGE